MNRCKHCDGSLKFVTYYGASIMDTYCSVTCLDKGENTQLELPLEDDTCKCKQCQETENVVTVKCTKKRTYSGC